MDDYNAIMNLLHVYAERFNEGDLEGTTDLFANAEIKWGPDAPVMNSAALLQLFKQNLIMHEGGSPKTHHVVTNEVIEIGDDGKTATARSYYTVVQQTAKTPFQAIAGGRYHDNLKKVNGKWIFTRRVLLFDFMGDVSDHIVVKS